MMRNERTNIGEEAANLSLPTGKATIHKVAAEDAAELLAIYAYYVEETAVSFEYEVPSLEEFTGRIKNISAAFPYLKAVDEKGTILGYAYAGRFHPRKAYDWSAETTVYIKKDCRRGGLGRALYEALERSLVDMGILNVNACIAVPQGEDPYLTMDSINFHTRMGYSLVGTFHNSGMKFDTWYDMAWMEKMLGDHKQGQEPVKFGAWKLISE